MSDIYSIPVTRPGGEQSDLKAYAGKVLLIVNTASRCGFTPQYDGLEKLQQRFGDEGFSVLAFPCNQFGAQEPGSDAQIANFCASNFGASFPIFAKIKVNGNGAAPLFKHLKKEAPGFLGGKSIKWNFTKFLVDQDGQVKERYAPTTAPADIAADIEALLR